MADAGVRRARRTGRAGGRRTLRATLAMLVTAVTVAVAAPSAVPAGAGAGHERTRAAMEAAVRDGIPGVLARAHDGRGPWQDSAGVSDLTTRRPYLPGDHFRTASIAKTFVATVLLQLEAEGRLAMGDTVETRLPGVVRGHGHDGRKITIRRLLNHTSGVFNYLDDPTVREKAYGKAFLEHRHDAWSGEQLVRLAMTHAPNFAPGTGWYYSNTEYTLAAMIVERVTGHPYATELRRRITEPLGLHSTTLPGADSRLPRPSGRAYTRFHDDPGTTHDVTEFNPSLLWAVGDLISTTADLDRFLGALLGGRLLPPAQLAEMTTTVPLGDDADSATGLGLFRYRLPCGVEVWGHDGLFYGTQSIAYATRDAAHRLVLDFNGDWLAGTRAAGDVLRAEFC
ncbi:serine hydrolase domain-containing protein [Streptomyces sp. NPDC046261]|uniref:serine hydrolase domain-containing protein n=1 Tax=Streptomyces sp. NPDC046261 TaxID=3157200 RepID=UPI00340439EF